MTRHYVHFSQPAITQLLLNGFEAFVIRHRHKKYSGIEMHASLYGYVEETSTTTHHYVEFISTDTSADMDYGSVGYDPETASLKRTLAAATGFRQVGAAHTHPYRKHEMPLSEVRAVGCQFSDGDLASFKQQLKEIGDSSYRVIQVAFAIRNLRHQNIENDGLLADNLFEFSVGNCKCFLLAQAFYLDVHGDLATEPTFIKCEYLEKFKHLGADFGRVVFASEKGRVLAHRP